MVNRFTFETSSPRVDWDTAFLSIRPVLLNNPALPSHSERIDCPVYVYRVGQKEIHRFNIFPPAFSLGWN